MAKSSNRICAGNHQWIAYAFGLVWLILAVVLVARTGSVIVDGFQSIGAIADTTNPGDLHWPMVGSFMGYDQTWGFHWIGWPLLRSVLLPFLPWHPLTEIILGCTLWLMASWGVMRMAQQNSQVMGVWVGILCLAVPGVFVAVQSYRPEVPTALFCIITLYCWRESGLFARILRTVSLVLLPMLHPLGLVVPGTWICWDILRNWHAVGLTRALMSIVPKLLPILAGVSVMVCWFWFQPDAGKQFLSNIHAQRLLTEGLGPGYWAVMRWGYGYLGVLPLGVLLMGSLVGSAIVLRDEWRQRAATSSTTFEAYAALGLIFAVTFNLLVKNPNTNHLLVILPLAAWLYFIALRRVLVSWKMAMQLVALIGSVALFSAVMGKNAYLLAKQNGRGYRNELNQALGELPPSRKVLIPVAMWEAAVLQQSSSPTRYQFSTFPNILEKKERLVYEQQVMADVQPGDLLIWDPMQELGGIFNFVEATALKHVLIHPHEQPMEWERLSEVRISVSYSKSQSNRFELYRKR